MKRSALAAAGILVLGLSSYLLPRDGVAFGPGADSKLSKSFEGQAEVSIDSLKVLVNGEEQESGMEGDQSGVMTYSIVVTDHFKALEGDRPTDLLRSFIEISGTSESSDGESSEGSLEDLEGKTVHFTWDPDAGAYTVKYEDGEGEEDALNLLIPDMDYRVLLPKGEVDDGAQWEIGGAELLRVLLPGLDLRQAAASGMELNGTAIPAKVVELMDKFLEGSKGTCTYAGTSEVDGVTLAEIGIEGKINGTTEFNPAELAPEETMDFGGDMNMTLTLDLDVKGTLLWNSQAGHFHSFELTSEGTMDMLMNMKIPDMDFDVETTAEASLSFEQKATAEKSE